MLEVQVHVDNFRVTPIDLLSVVHPLPQELAKEGEAFGLVLGGRHLDPDW